MADVTGNQINNDGDLRGPVVGGNAGQVGDRYHEGYLGNRVEINTDRLGRPNVEPEDLYRVLAEDVYRVRVALLGDEYNRRSNPGLVAKVEELADKFASLVAANSAQAFRLDSADKERKQISENQQAIIASITEYRKDNDNRVAGLASRQTSMMVMMWVMLAVLLAEGSYLIYLSI